MVLDNARLGLLQGPEFVGDLEDSESTSGGTLCVLGSHTFVPTSWMCKKQTSVSYSSTDLALELWDPIVSVLGNVSRVSDRSGKPESDDYKHHKSHNKIDAMQDIDVVPLNVQSARQEALLNVFEDNEAVIKTITKEETLQWDTSLEPSELRLVGFSIESIWIQKSKLSTSTPKKVTKILTKGNFTRDEWKQLCLLNIRQFSSTDCSEGMSKRTQQESGEERVTAKSRPMMSLIARAPSTLSSSASENFGKKRYGSQSPWIAKAEKQDRTGHLLWEWCKSWVSAPPQFVESSYSARHSRWDDDKAWSSEEWKAN